MCVYILPIYLALSTFINIFSLFHQNTIFQEIHYTINKYMLFLLLTFQSSTILPYTVSYTLTSAPV